jgi:hypothetical protein
MAAIISPRTACRYLRDINDPGMQFHSRDGKTLKNLVELSGYLKACEKGHFQHHVSPKHNHFSNWVGNQVLDKDLADQMGLVLEKNPMYLIVIKRINVLVRHATRTPRGREKARMIMENARLPEEMFITNDGRSLRNLWELKQFIESAPEHVLSYHLHGNKNDFHDWVREVLMDIELADLIWEARDKEALLEQIEKRLSYLESFDIYQKRKQALEDTIQRVHECPVYYT